jgi:cysteine-rich repeat protein
MRAWVVAVMLAGCVHSQSQECGDGRLCPQGNVCDTMHSLCVTPPQADVCKTLNEGDPCTAGDFAGICNHGTCLPGCGNAVVEDLSTLHLGIAEECDDGNFASHDGCSSRCTVEVPVWTEWQSPWKPRMGHAAAFDAQRGKLVIFGGFSESGVTSDLWERKRSPTPSDVDGDTWLSLRIFNTPPARAEAAMAYDSMRHKVVLFGGVDGNAAPLGDQWEYDGIAWTKVMPANPPPARHGAAMAYDPVRQKLVLVGGFVSNAVPLAETWEYTAAGNRAAVRRPRVHAARMGSSAPEDRVVRWPRREHRDLAVRWRVDAADNSGTDSALRRADGLLRCARRGRAVRRRDHARLCSGSVGARLRLGHLDAACCRPADSTAPRVWRARS